MKVLETIVKVDWICVAEKTKRNRRTHAADDFFHSVHGRANDREHCSVKFIFRKEFLSAMLAMVPTTRRIEEHIQIGKEILGRLVAPLISFYDVGDACMVIRAVLRCVNRKRLEKCNRMNVDQHIP